MNHVILETLDRINKALAGNANALVLDESGCVDPDRAYIQLVQRLLTLTEPTP